MDHNCFKKGFEMKDFKNILYSITIGFNSILLLLITIIFLIPNSAFANVPMVPVAYLMGFTLLNFVRTIGIALTAIVLIEALVLHIRERDRLNYLQCLILAVLANTFSTMIGVAIFIAYSSSFMLLLVGIPSALGYAAMTRYICKMTGLWPLLEKRMGLLVTIFAIGFIFIIPMLGMYTIPGFTYFHIKGITEFTNSFTIIVAVIMAILLLFIGFILSFIAEGVVIIKNVKSRDKKLVVSVLIMNVVSYIVLTLTSSFYIRSIIIDRGWFWHR